MTVQTIDPLLSRVAGEVLETMAFAFVMPDPDVDDQPVTGPVLRASVTFGGAFEGTLVLTAQEPVVASFAANMLGLDEGEPCTPRQRGDAFGEIANVMCGNLLVELAGPEPVFDLSEPQVAAFDEADEAPPLPADAQRVRVPLDEGWVDVAFRRGGDGPAVR